MIRHISNKLNKEFLWKKIHNCNVSTGSAGGNNNSWNYAVSLICGRGKFFCIRGCPLNYFRLFWKIVLKSTFFWHTVHPHYFWFLFSRYFTENCEGNLYWASELLWSVKFINIYRNLNFEENNLHTTFHLNHLDIHFCNNWSK